MFKTKTFVTIALIVSWTALVALVTAGFVYRQPSAPSSADLHVSGTGLQNNVSGSGVQNGQRPLGSSGKVGLTMAEISKHNSASDCWLLISGKVYNVTTFIPMHPGGESTIITYCGQDATVAFDTKGGRGAHSQNARDILASYYIGNLNSSVNQSAVQKTAQGSSSQTFPVSDE